MLQVLQQCLFSSKLIKDISFLLIFTLGSLYLFHKLVHFWDTSLSSRLVVFLFFLSSLLHKTPSIVCRASYFEVSVRMTVFCIKILNLLTIDVTAVHSGVDAAYLPACSGR